MQQRQGYFQTFRLERGETVLWKSKADNQRFVDLVAPVCIGTGVLCALLLVVVAYFANILDRGLIAAGAVLTCGVVGGIAFRQTLRSMPEDFPYIVTNQRVILLERRGMKAVPQDLLCEVQVNRCSDGTTDLRFKDAKGSVLLTMSRIPGVSSELAESVLKTKLKFVTTDSANTLKRIASP
ncbi:MAG: hypothetical protein K2W95_19385 [Candidatus Obscuribacterales bacterium]|nr:hypothetical protein [Candidatus Obscuribacterales bacterium]